MSENDELSALREEFVGVHDCHTVILYGSRAIGDATPESDWDVAGVRARGEMFRVSRPWRGTFLDAFVYADAEVSEPNEDLLKLRGGRLLEDANGFGARLLARLDAFYESGPPLRPAWHWEMQRVWFAKTLARIRRDDVEARLRRGWLVMEALENYFCFRHRFYPGPKQGLAWLRENDPATFSCFEEALRPQAGFAPVERLVEVLLASPIPPSPTLAGSSC